MSYVIVALFCIVFPLVGMYFIHNLLKKRAPRKTNFRKASVYLGLGLVWPVYGLGILIAYLLMNVLKTSPQFEWFAILHLSVPVIFVVYALGWIDDTFGEARYRGFKGHLGALKQGILTTGSIKFFGIGFASVIFALFLAPPLVEWTIFDVVVVILRALIIGLMANLLNLFDVRPARALKVYSAFLILFVIIWLVLSQFSYLNLAFLSLVPAIAIWAPDAREMGMLGDAGANTMGAYLGFLIAATLPVCLLVIFVIGIGALNVISEKVSFTQVIEKSPWLNSIDKLGRK